MCYQNFLKCYLDVSWYKINMFHISCVMSLLFVMDSVLELGVGYFAYVFHIKLSNFGNGSFHAHYDVYKTRTILQD